MRALIVSDHDPISSQVRSSLLQAGLEVRMARLDIAPTAVDQPAADVLIVVLSPDPGRAVEKLADLRPHTRARLLALGPTFDPKLMLRALRAGADDYLDEVEVGPDLRAALARHRPLDGQAAPVDLGKVIAVVGPSGGCGASTVAANVATVLARQQKRCGLIDLKLEKGDLAALLDLKPNHTLAELCQSAARMDRVMLERSLVAHPSGVHLLAPPRAFADIAYVTPEGVRQALSLTRSLFPYVVVDLDHPSRPEQMQTIEQAEAILVVFRLDFTSLRNTRRALEYLEGRGIKPETIHLVVNRYGQAKEVPYAKAEEALGRKIPHYLPDDPTSVNRANNNGVPVVLESPSAKVSRNLTTLAASVNGRHPGK